MAGTLLLVLLGQLPLLDAPFSDRHEAREAVVVADILRHGHWIAPHPNQDRIPTKGPLTYWWAAAVSLPFGLHAWAMRLSILLLMTGTLAATVALGSLIDSRRTGWIAAGILGTSLLYWRFMLYLRVDPGLVFCVTATMLALTWGLSRPGARRLGNLASQLALAGACFAKGLPALVPTVSTVAAACGIRGERSWLASWAFTLLLGASVLVHPALLAMAALVALARLRQGPDPASAALDLLPGVVLVALVAGWLHLADARYPIPYLEYVVTESTKRIVARGPPVWFYLPDFTKQFFPWSLLVPVALAAAVVRVRQDRSDPIAVPLAWLLGTFVLFSLFDRKRTPYLLPLYPAAALLVASAIAPRRPSGPGIARWLRRSDAVLAAAGAAVCLAALSDLAWVVLRGEGWIPLSSRTPLMQQIGAWRVPVDLVLAGSGGLWAGSLAARGVRRWRLVFVGQAAVLTFAGVLVSSAPPEYDDAPDRFARRIARVLPEEADLRYVYGARDYGLIYYLGRRMRGIHARGLPRLVAEPAAPPVYLLVTEPGSLPTELRARTEELARGRGSDNWLYLLRVSAQPVAAPPGPPRTTP